MRRSGRINSPSVPAFFTRSKAKNFFNTSSNATPNQKGNKQEEQDGEVTRPENQEQVVQSENTNSQTPKPKAGLNETQEAEPQSKSSNDVINPLAVSDGSENSVQELHPTEIKEEMKFEDLQPKVQLKKDNNVGISDNKCKDVSATTKALARMKQNISTKKEIRKKQKVPLCVRRQKLNERLNRILVPKSGLIFLNELKPGCTFKIQEQPGSNPLVFIAQVEYGNKVVAVGQGVTKIIAKNAAAENAIKVFVAEAFTQRAIKNENQSHKGVQKLSPNGSEHELMDTSDDLSLASLASFAMYKMFTEWQSQGTDFPLFSFQPKKKVTVSKIPPMKKELPPNAEKLHPCFLLNTMRPGLLSTELERSSKDNISFVTVGYEIDGKMYRGSGSNKKEARKRAAQVAITDLYGIKYDD